MLSAWASAAVIAVPLGKRASGSLAMLCNMTAESAGEMFGLMSAGEGRFFIHMLHHDSDWIIAPERCDTGHYFVQDDTQ